MTFDDYSLESWLESEALDAHNRAAKPSTPIDDACNKRDEETYNRVLNWVRDSRKRNGRPHVRNELQ